MIDRPAGTQPPPLPWAAPLTTALTWDDLVLPPETLRDVEEILAWIEHGDTILKDPGIGRFFGRGYRSLFHGPSGTGKTLTAALLGKESQREVYRADLSMIASGGLGRAKDDLTILLEQTEANGGILFLDEADALFGKRTDVSDSNDRYANQEVSYLLQRVANFKGLVILETNLRTNIDAARALRFTSMIYFPLPDPGDRLRIWRNTFRGAPGLDPDIDFQALAETHELSGSAIANVLRSAVLAAFRKDPRTITERDIEHGIARELRKEGRVASND